MRSYSPPILSLFKIETLGFFLVCPGAEIWPHSQWNLGDFFPNFEKKSQSSKQFFFWRLGFLFSHHTHKQAT